ncbi:hypothetical protein [Parasediminibacterium sp. JCM 36343]|uniref:hypothetical protein n=1 Tax=Parasediminibacterium sp. JCM 36343 TaxID=3374279 RepID=UPI00397E0746
MSKQSGLIKLEGTIGGIAFYQSNGEHLARIANGPSKERIATDASFVRTRENNTEFGGSASMGKAFRLAFASVVQTSADKLLASRLTAIFRDICNKDTTGVRGQRSILLSANPNNLVNFDFDPSISLTAIFNAPYTNTHVVARNDATISVPSFVPSTFIQAPAGATHFKLIHALGVVSDYTYDTTLKSYEPASATLNTIGAVVSSATTALGSTATTAFTLDATLPGTPTMTTNANVVQALGIQFYQRVGTVDYLLAQGNAFKVIKVF